MLIGSDVKLNSPSSLIGQALTEILQHPERARDALRVLLHLVRQLGASPQAPHGALLARNAQGVRLKRVRGTAGYEQVEGWLFPAIWVKPVVPSRGHDVWHNTDGCSRPRQDPAGGGSRGVTWSRGPHHSHFWAMWLWAMNLAL